MLSSVGLRTHIWNNNLKSVLLLAGFPVLLFGLFYAVELLGLSYVALDQGRSLSPEALMETALGHSIRAIPWLILGALAWFAIAWRFHQSLIDLSTGAHGVTREAEPELYNLLENLAISRGLPMPGLRIIESEALNAYATGLSEDRAVITVTRGLVQTLDRDELEAVLAHELTHVINRDVRLLVIAVIFAGIISFVVELMFRGMLRGALVRSGGARRGRSGNASVIVLIALALAALAYVLAIVIRFALSRSREFMADAGAVELTKNPDAMISALEKISGHCTLEDAPREVRQMFIHDTGAAFAGLFATHPPIEKRIAALEQFAGGRRRSRSASRSVSEV